MLNLYIWDVGDGECSQPYMAFAYSEEDARDWLLKISYDEELKEKKEVINGTHIFLKYHSKEKILDDVGESFRAEREQLREPASIYEIKEGIL
jgi:hypothetical protein